MQKKYREIYSELLGGWKAMWSGNIHGLGSIYPTFSSGLYDRIRKIEVELGITLRPDARLLLQINFQIMIMQPLYDGKLIDVTQIYNMIDHDLAFLMSRAGEERSVSYEGRGEDENEISAHAILDALSKSWKQLKVSEVNLWE